MGGDGFKLLELLTQDDDSREKKADAGSLIALPPRRAYSMRQACQQ